MRPRARCTSQLILGGRSLGLRKNYCVATAINHSELSKAPRFVLNGPIGMDYSLFERLLIESIDTQHIYAATRRFGNFGILAVPEMDLNRTSLDPGVLRVLECQ